MTHSKQTLNKGASITATQIWISEHWAQFIEDLFISEIILIIIIKSEIYKKHYSWFKKIF